MDCRVKPGNDELVRPLPSSSPGRSGRRKSRSSRPSRAAACWAQSARRISSPARGRASTNQPVPMSSIHDSVPPENGAKPKPRMEPTSASRTSVSTCSSKQRAVSKRLDAEQAQFQFLDIDRIGIELLRLQFGQARPQLLGLARRVIVEALAVLAAEAAALLHHLLEQRLLARVDGLGAEIGLGRLQDLPGQIDRHLVVERRAARPACRPCGRHSRSSPPARPR